MESRYHSETVAKPPTRANFLKFALDYADRGIPILPLKGKEPLTPRGFKDASTDRSRIHAWSSKHRSANIGIPTGSMSGLVVVDLDEPTPEASRIWDSLPPSVEVRTGRGRHRYYRIGTDATVRGRKLAPGLDLKAEGGYVVAPPSIHDCGARYRWVSLGNDIAPLPDELVEPEARLRSMTNASADGPICEGVRNQTLFFLALDVKDSGKSRDVALAELLDINATRCLPQLAETEVAAIVKSAYRYPIRGKRTPPEVLEALKELKQAWWATPWRGVGGKTDRDILRVLIQLGERYGHLIPAGVRVSISYRDLALAAGCGRKTVERVIKRLRVRRWLRGDNSHRSGTNSGAFVLLPRPTDDTQSMVWFAAGGDAESVVTLSTLPEITPCFRWRGFVGKGKAGVLYILEVLGPQSLEEIAGRLGWQNVRDLKCRYLKPLAEMGLIEERGGFYALPDDVRYVKRVQEVRAAPHGGGPRKVRRKDHHGRWVSRVVEVPPMSEDEREEADRLAYEDQRRNHRGEGVEPSPHVANIGADGYTTELKVVPNTDGELLAALREFLRCNPHRCGEMPSWFSVALWAHDYLPTKPDRGAVELALADLEREGAA
jgi:hypothetical protein